jgi:hypothetical protein
MRKLLPVLTTAFMLSGCAALQNDLSEINVFANKYGPIIGRDLLMIANILVQAECSPLNPAATAVAGNILNIVAPDSPSAAKVGAVLAANAAVAQQLCPLVASIRAVPGLVPAGTPSQVVLPNS